MVPASAFHYQCHPSPGEGNKRGGRGEPGASLAASTIGQQDETMPSDWMTHQQKLHGKVSLFFY
jgi:hypothetical protein